MRDSKVAGTDNLNRNEGEQGLCLLQLVQIISQGNYPGNYPGEGDIEYLLDRCGVAS